MKNSILSFLRLLFALTIVVSFLAFYLVNITPLPGLSQDGSRYSEVSDFLWVILGTAVALAGSLVAITLAQRSLDTAEKQNTLAKRQNELEERQNELEEWQILDKKIGSIVTLFTALIYDLNMCCVTANAYIKNAAYVEGNEVKLNIDTPTDQMLEHNKAAIRSLLRTLRKIYELELSQRILQDKANCFAKKYSMFDNILDVINKIKEQNTQEDARKKHYCREFIIYKENKKNKLQAFNNMTNKVEDNENLKDLDILTAGGVSLCKEPQVPDLISAGETFIFLLTNSIPTIDDIKKEFLKNNDNPVSMEILDKYIKSLDYNPEELKPYYLKNGVAEIEKIINPNNRHILNNIVILYSFLSFLERKINDMAKNGEEVETISNSLKFLHISICEDIKLDGDKINEEDVGTELIEILDKNNKIINRLNNKTIEPTESFFIIYSFENLRGSITIHDFFPTSVTKEIRK